MYKTYIKSDPDLIVGKEYLVVTFSGEYHIDEYTGKGFFGFPFMVKAWCDFERYGGDL